MACDHVVDDFGTLIRQILSSQPAKP